MPSVDDMGDMDDDDDCLIFPLTDVDNNNSGDKNHVECKSAEKADHRRHDIGDGDGRVGSRRRCKSFGCQSERSHAVPMPSHSFSTAHHLSLKLNTSGHLLSPMSSSPKCNWMHAVRKIKHLKDPWERYHILDMPTETATRHRYHPLKKQWVIDKVEVKMEREVTVVLLCRLSILCLCVTSST